MCGCSGPYHDCIVTGTAYRCKHVLQPRISPLRVEVSFRGPALVVPCVSEEGRDEAKGEGRKLASKCVNQWKKKMKRKGRKESEGFINCSLVFRISVVNQERSVNSEHLNDLVTGSSCNLISLSICILSFISPSFNFFFCQTGWIKVVLIFFFL